MESARAAISMQIRPWPARLQFVPLQPMLLPELGVRHVLSAAYDPDRPRPLRGAARGRAGPPRLSRRRREHGERTVIMSPGPENHSLAEKIAVVTGAGSGIGRADIPERSSFGG